MKVYLWLAKRQQRRIEKLEKKLVKFQYYVKKTKQWIKSNGGSPQPPYDVTVCTYIRNTIHHPENTLNQAFTEEDLNSSISNMINLIENTLR